jgi:hypothetical protein
VKLIENERLHRRSNRPAAISIDSSQRSFRC